MCVGGGSSVAACSMGIQSAGRAGALAHVTWWIAEDGTPSHVLHSATGHEKSPRLHECIPCRNAWVMDSWAMADCQAYVSPVCSGQLQTP